MTTKNPPSPDLSVYIEAIEQRSRPAQKPEQATHRFTTSEVRDAIEEINPVIKATLEQVAAAMTAAGFSFWTIPGAQSLRFWWLLVEK